MPLRILIIKAITWFGICILMVRLTPIAIATPMINVANIVKKAIATIVSIHGLKIGSTMMRIQPLDTIFIIFFRLMAM